MKTKGFIIGLIICFVVGICVTTIVCEIYSSVREITNLCSYEQEILNAQEYRYKNNLKIINNKEDLIDLYNTKLQSMYDKQNSLRDMLISESNKYSDINNQSEKMQQTLNELQESYFNLREEINNIKKDTLLSCQDKEILINKANKVISVYESKFEELNFWLNSYCLKLIEEVRFIILLNGKRHYFYTDDYSVGWISLADLETLINLDSGYFRFESRPRILAYIGYDGPFSNHFVGWLNNYSDHEVISSNESNFNFNFYCENGNKFNVEDFSSYLQFYITIKNFRYDGNENTVYLDFYLKIYY